MLMAYYDLSDWNYERKFLPTETETTYADYSDKVDAAVNATGASKMYRVADLLNNRITGIVTNTQELNRFAAGSRLVRLRQTPAGDFTWRHYFCSATDEEVFLMTQAHWETEFTVA